MQTDGHQVHGRQLAVQHLHQPTHLQFHTSPGGCDEEIEFRPCSEGRDKGENPFVSQLAHLELNPVFKPCLSRD